MSESLITAVQEKDYAFVNSWIQAGKELNLQDSDEQHLGWTALMHASFLGHATLVKTLAKAGADLECVDDVERTALILAAQNRQNLAGSTLLRLGANVNHKDIYERAAISYASEQGNVCLMGRLVDARASTSDVREFQFIEAAINGHLRPIKSLLKQGVFVDSKNRAGYTALVKASHNGHSKIVQLLLDSGAGINLKGGGFTPLMIAAYRGRPRIVQILLEAGADPTPDNGGLTAMMYARLEGHKKVVELLENADHQLA